MATPFPYLLSFPAKLLAGQAENVLGGFFILFCWGLLFTLSSIYTWRLGVRRYSAMGA